MCIKEYGPLDGDVMPTEERHYYEIDNDLTADYAVKAIKAEEQATERLIEIVQAQIAELEGKIDHLRKRCEKRTQEKRDALNRYFDTVERRETKTTEKYDLLSGTLVRKKPTTALKVDDCEKLIDWLEQRREFGGYITTIKKPRWGELKKMIECDVYGNVIISETGEIIEGVKAEEKPETFLIDY